jgi:hypothetical protein
VRLKLAQFFAVVFFSCAALVPCASAQNPDTMMPEASAAKAKQVLAQLIDAMGGPAYLGVRESQCSGRRALFGHNSETTGFVLFTDERRYPDKDRTEYIAKGHNGILGSLIGIDGLYVTHGGTVVTLYNGTQGWTLDRSGVSEVPATAITDFQESVQRNIDNLLRVRLKEPGMIFRYGGRDTVDLKQVDWVELTDSAERTFRLAVDQTTHLLVHSVVGTIDEESHQRNDETTIYTNYQLKEGVQVAMQISREKNGRRTYQAFYDSCRYNPNFPDDLFTRSGLDKHGSELGVKKK